MEILQARRLSQNQLKIVAAIAMLIDHIGAQILPQIVIFRIIGRLAFPIFSYFIYEGFYYTKNRKIYFSKIFVLGIICAGIYYMYSGEIYGNVLITFSLSIVALYVTEILHKVMSRKEILLVLSGTSGSNRNAIYGNMTELKEARLWQKR